MSEALEKVRSIKQLALFPLPLVLLPHESLPLHIFEPKYREMLRDIETDRNLFGIIYFEQNETFSERPEVGSIGCVAEIRESQTMEDGRSNILVDGLIRYRILKYTDDGRPYLTTRVEFFEDVRQEEEALAPIADAIFELFQRVAKSAFDLSGKRGELPEIQRSDPERLSFIVAAAFNLDNDLKTELLETCSTIDRLENLRGVLEPAAKAMEDSAVIHRVAQQNGHSKKKIDI